MGGTADEAVIDEVFREVHGRAVATLTRLFGNLDAAEDAVQDAFERASATWPQRGVPPDPAGWIVTTARRRAVDSFRSNAARRRRQEEEVRTMPDQRPDEVRPIDETLTGPVDDDLLRLIFTCCHPALATAAQVGLALRLLCGLSTGEVAAAFLVPEPTMAQRIVRAKRKIALARIPYEVPGDAALPNRLRSVMAVVYLIYTQGHTAADGQAAVRVDLCREGLRLARLLRQLMPDEEEAAGLLALLLFSESRRPARVRPGGRLVTLAEQDRTRWDVELIAEAREVLAWCLRRGRLGPYQLQAAIQAVHAGAARPDQTDWPQILALYDQLVAVAPTPVTALNRAVAVAEVEGPKAALAALEGMGEELEPYAPFHVTRAEMLQRLGEVERADQAFAAAEARSDNPGVRAHIRRQRKALRESEPFG